MSDTPNEPRQFRPGAAALAWLWPGLGHVVLGEKRRGILIMCGVLFLFLSGLAIGGVSAVDRINAHLWFYAQAGCGPIAFAADYANQHYVQQLPDEERWRLISIGRINEMGTLFVALAGLMNMIVVLDALHFMPRTPRRRAEDQQP